jgi:hypothetical protein
MARDDLPASAMAMLWTLARNQIAGGIGLSLVGPSAILSISTANRRRQATSSILSPSRANAAGSTPARPSKSGRMLG